MRADRLISIMLLLQKRKRITTHELAVELGVSTRTIFRDLVALGANGFPIYAEHGPGGGVCLIEEYRDGLKTLTVDEVDALQSMRIPDALTSLDAGKSLQRALLKMATATPSQRTASTLFIDWNWWGQTGLVPKDRLELIHSAINRCLKLQVEFPLWNRNIFSQQINPFGIVAKAGEWYLVYESAGRVRMRRIRDLKKIQLTEQTFIRPVDFDLEAAWKILCHEQEDDYYRYRVIVNVSPEIASIFEEPFWGVPFRVRSRAEEADARSWMLCELEFENLIAARAHLLGWGSAVEVLEPMELRLSLVDFARQIMGIYEQVIK